MINKKTLIAGVVFCLAWFCFNIFWFSYMPRKVLKANPVWTISLERELFTTRDNKELLVTVEVKINAFKWSQDFSKLWKRLKPETRILVLERWAKVSLEKSFASYTAPELISNPSNPSQRLVTTFQIENMLLDSLGAKKKYVIGLSGLHLFFPRVKRPVIPLTKKQPDSLNALYLSPP